jgi:RNA polymerase sigma factor (sigma-70 family)
MDEFNHPKGQPELHLICHDIVKTLTEKNQWGLLSPEELEAAVLASTPAEASPSELKRLAKHHYTIALYEACRQTQNPSRREQGYQELFRFLFRVAHYRWPNLAEDITQRALVLVYEQFERCQNPGTFLAFALNKLRHAGQQELRARGRELLQEEMSVEGVESHDQTNTGASLEDEEQLRVLVEAIGQLPDKRQQSVLLLKFFRGLSDETIGTQLSSTANHIRVLRHRALIQLRRNDALQNYMDLV